MRVVCISDTHNAHNLLTIPDGDVLIHAGDYTNYGKREHAERFNEWLGTLPHKHKLIVNGNHEANAPWKKECSSILSNATFLNQNAITIDGITFFGTGFFWPCPTGNPNFSQIPEGCDVVIAHGPAKGYVDGDKGCPSLTAHIANLQPQLVVSGHIHFAYGITHSVVTPTPRTHPQTQIPASEESQEFKVPKHLQAKTMDMNGPTPIIFVNCATCVGEGGDSPVSVRDPIVVELFPRNVSE